MKLPDGPLLIVSPHLDDAILSCGALLERGEPAEVLSVFAGFPVPNRRVQADIERGFEHSGEALAARHLETQTMLEGTPHRLVAMELIDGRYLDAPRSEGEAAAVARAIHAWLRRCGGGTVALPACAGSVPSGWRRLLRPNAPAQDPDHLFVRDAGLGALRALPSVGIWLYEEYPHAVGARADAAVRSLCASSGMRASGVGAFRVSARQRARRRRIFGERGLSGLWASFSGGAKETERYWALVPR